MNCLVVEHLTINLQRTAQSSGKQSGGREHFVSDVSFSIEERNTLAVIGASGLGKTLTAFAVMGLLDCAVFFVHGSCVFSAQGCADYDAADTVQQKVLRKDASVAVDNATRRKAAGSSPKRGNAIAADMPVNLFSLTEQERKRYCMEQSR